MSREDRVVVGLDEENVIKREDENRDVRVGTVKIWYWDPDPRVTSCD